MKRKHSPSCFWIILLSILLLDIAVLKAQSRAIRPVNLQIPNEGEVQLYRGSYALVIGVSDYQDNAWVDLGSVKADVDAVRETLQEHGFAVQTVINPTESVLLDRINEFIDAYGYEQENRLLFYYAGHGHTQERNGRKFGYLVPADAPNPFENEKEFFRKSLKMEQIISWAKQIESKHALFMFDSCFSGSVLQSRAVTVPEDISYLTAKPVRQFISAGSANQTVPAISVFRPLFIRGINGQADLDQDGYVTGVELGMYLQKQVPRYQTGQTPQYGKILDPYLDEGNFVFEVENRRKSETKTATLYLRENDWFNGSRFNPASWKTSRLLESDIVYVGEVSNGLPNGQGTFTWLDGAKYVGEFKDGKANGQGTFTFPDGGKYVGEFKDDKYHGQGTFTWLDGGKYVGEWGNGGWNGHGTLTSSASEKYVGEFKNGNYHGQGTFTSADGQVLSGLWKDGKFVSENQSPSKTVTLYISKDKWENYLKSIPSNWTTNRILESDIVYVGEVSNGLPNGQGTVTWPDGTKHVGAWKDGFANGQGTLTWPSGDKYVGEFKDNKYHGQGTFSSPDGLKYVGEFKDDKKHGQGTFTSPDGLKYVGEWKDGFANGQGTLTWPSGDKYVGEFKDDKKHGQGTYTFPDGKMQNGLWEDGKFVGETTGQQKEITSKIVTLYISLDTWKYDSKSIPANWETSRNLESDHVYVGEVSNELPNGQGTLTFSDGTKYLGEFRDGQFSGQGTHSFSDGAKYVGEFRDGQFNGQGTYTWPDGTKYIGYWLNGLKNGQGTQTFPDGQVKNGLWIFDKFSEAKPVQQEQQEKPVQTEQLKSGAMTLYISKDDWLSGMESNPASWKTQNNLESDLSFVGEVNNGVPNGWGSWESSDGYKYVGEWVAGKWHGQGTYTSPDGTKYVGEWANNEWHGQGTHTSSDGTKYVGEYKNGLEHGQGTWTRLNGDEYVGEWEDGERSGQGTYTYSDGTKYVGSFRNGRFHGQGTFTWPEGRWWLNETNEIEKKGFWRNGEFVGSP